MYTLYLKVLYELLACPSMLAHTYAHIYIYIYIYIYTHTHTQDEEPASPSKRDYSGTSMSSECPHAKEPPCMPAHVRVTVLDVKHLPDGDKSAAETYCFSQIGDLKHRTSALSKSISQRVCMLHMHVQK
jgi:hypothetical protein